MKRSHRRKKSPTQDQISQRRLKFSFVLIVFTFFTVILRLYYWQIIKGPALKLQAQEQSNQIIEKRGQRGKIYTAKGNLLVGNKTVYQLYADKSLQQEENEVFADRIAPILFEAQENKIDLEEKIKNSYSFTIDQYLHEDQADHQPNDRQNEKIEYQGYRHNLLQKLTKNKTWILLENEISEETRKKLDALSIVGLQYVPQSVRFYPEKDMASHITGFVGRNSVGYFGIEGALNNELKGKKESFILNEENYTSITQLNQKKSTSINGRDIYLTIQRDLQNLVESELKQGLKTYGAESGEIIITRPQTGEILALAAYPNYNQEHFYIFPRENYINPTIAKTYEPGSTFKVITMAIGIENNSVSPNTECSKCAGPRDFNGYTIKTWNERYHPNINMTDALVKSDNTAMIFVAELLGADRFAQGLQDFGIGHKTNLDLQEDIETPFPKSWRPVELATASFGQGISTTSLQLTRAVNAIANQGEMMELRIIKKVVNPDTKEEMMIKPEVMNQAISAKTAHLVTKMMVKAAEHEHEDWLDHVAGKTGTAQIPDEGGYQEDKTIASYIAFYPADNPQFTMYVKLNKPSASPWGATTAMPLWHKIAKKVTLMINLAEE